MFGDLGFWGDFGFGCFLVDLWVFEWFPSGFVGFRVFYDVLLRFFGCF